MRKWAGLLILLLSLGLVLAACGSDSEEPSDSGDSASTDTEATDREASSGGVLNIAVSAQPPTLDTHLTTAIVALDVTRNIFETLVTLNGEFEAVPMLAESIDVSDDGLTYTFKLREGIKFHNGKEMTAEDVVASMNRWLEKSSRAVMLLAGASFEEVDTYTVQLNLQERATDTLDIMAGQGQFAAIMPKEVIESAGEDGVQEIIGTGPFKFNEWKQDQYIHLVKYDEYQPRDEEPSGYAGRKEALVDDLYYHIVTDTSTRIAGLQTGEYHIAEQIAPDNYEQLLNSDGIVAHTYLAGTNNMFFNKKEGIMSNKLMRQAVNIALDMEEIMLASFANEDLFFMHSSFMNPEQANWVSESGKESYNQADTERAKQLLEEAGYNGEEVRMMATRDYDHHYSAAVVVQEQLENIGVNVKLEIFDWPTLNQRINDPELWDIFFTSTGYITTPSQLLPLNSDFAGWTNDPKITELLNAMRTAETLEEAEAHWDELQGFLWNDYVSNSMFGHYSNILGTTDKLEGFTVFRGTIPWNTKVLE